MKRVHRRTASSTSRRSAGGLPSNPFLFLPSSFTHIKGCHTCISLPTSNPSGVHGGKEKEKSARNDVGPEIGSKDGCLAYLTVVRASAWERGVEGE
jgi:hypothetical protein